MIKMNINLDMFLNIFDKIQRSSRDNESYLSLIFVASHIPHNVECIEFFQFAQIKFEIFF